MKAEITTEGKLLLIPETQTEGYAIDQFVKDTSKQVVKGVWAQIENTGGIATTYFFVVETVVPNEAAAEPEKKAKLHSLYDKYVASHLIITRDHKDSVIYKSDISRLTQGSVVTHKFISFPYTDTTQTYICVSDGLYLVLCYIPGLLSLHWSDEPAPYSKKGVQAYMAVTNAFTNLGYEVGAGDSIEVDHMDYIIQFLPDLIKTL